MPSREVVVVVITCTELLAPEAATAEPFGEKNNRVCTPSVCHKRTQPLNFFGPSVQDRASFSTNLDSSGLI